MSENSPKKDGKCHLEQYSRISGYLSPLVRWNPGKVSEWHDRKMFDKSLKDDELYPPIEKDGWK